jgi:SAM-dependent methyltransferase
LIRRSALTEQEEQELHEVVAQHDSHEQQTRGIVGWFYRLYIAETRRFAREHGPKILDIGSGEGVIFKGGDAPPIQLDVSRTRLLRAKEHTSSLVCGDAYVLPFASCSFDAVLLIAVLEHTSQPVKVLDEVHRVLKPGGHLAVLVPNDISLSVGRLLLGKWPPRYPDHLSWITPGLVSRWAEPRFSVAEGFPLPFRRLSFWLNMYYFASLQKRADSTEAQR